jgi:hypothetical protein
MILHKLNIQWHCTLRALCLDLVCTLVLLLCACRSIALAAGPGQLPDLWLTPLFGVGAVVSGRALWAYQRQDGSGAATPCSSGTLQCSSHKCSSSNPVLIGRKDRLQERNTQTGAAEGCAAVVQSLLSTDTITPHHAGNCLALYCCPLRHFSADAWCMLHHKITYGTDT